jgi:hypothetical protein
MASNDGMRPGVPSYITRHPAHRAIEGRILALTNVQTYTPATSPAEPRPATSALSIQIIDGFSQKGIEGVEVCFGYKFGYKTSAPPGERTFQLEQQDYRVIATLKTDAQGGVSFTNPHLWSGEACAICIEATGYRQAFGSTVDVLTGEVRPMREGETICATAILAPERLNLEETFGATVDAYLRSLACIRVRVLQGANCGNQSAGISLVESLRLAGYQGRIQVLCDAAPRLEDQSIEAELEFLVASDEESALATLQRALEERLDGTYAGRVHFHDEVYTATAHPIQASLASGLDRDDGRRPFPTAMLRSVCDLDLSDRTSPLSLMELEAMVLELVPLGLVAYALRDSAGGRVAAELSTPAAADRSVMAALSVELNVRTHADMSVMDKLLTLRPDLNTAEDLAGVEWLPATSFEEDASKDPTVLGIVPSGEDYSDVRLMNLRREALKTECLLALQPLHWFSDMRALCFAGSLPKRLYLPRAATYQLSPLRRGDPRTAISMLCAAAKQDALIAPLTALYVRAQEQRIDLMTVYGLHQAKRSPVRVLLDNLIASLVAVQTPRGRPTVILVLYKLDDLAEQVSAASARHAMYTRAAEALAPLGKVTCGEVLLVHAPVLPQQVFELFCRASTLPLLLEGANTTNLAQMMSLPYLSVASKDTDYIKLAGPDCPDYHRLKRCEDELNQEPDAEIDEDTPRRQHLEAYLADTLTHGDQVMNGYFTKLQRYVRQPERDQLLLGLYRVATELEARRRPSPAEQPDPGWSNSTQVGV